jgi:hypothetical protein
MGSDKRQALPACFTGTIGGFLRAPYEKWMEEMSQHFRQLCGESPGDSQMAAWGDCYRKVKPVFESLDNDEGYLAFEYELPREGGRRPDLIVLSGKNVFVIEFKQKRVVLQEDVDQVAAYARDIKNYHAQSRNLDVWPILMPTVSADIDDLIENVQVCSPNTLADFLKQKVTNDSLAVDPQDWLTSEYEPLPTLVAAARMIYENEPLPNIRRADSAGIPAAAAALIKLADSASHGHERVLALATGVPGSGKTLLGLSFVHEYCTDKSDRKGVFLSGNGPLVEVLQDALQNKVFVQDLRNFVKHYGVERRGTPGEHIVVFDEAQRAWDADRVYEKHNTRQSEPDLIMQIADSMPDWAMFVGLVGEGQEIHTGEEAGMKQWREALQKNTKHRWKVVCPAKIAHLFVGVADVEQQDALDLTTSLRSHLAEHVTQWVDALLGGDVPLAAKLGVSVAEQGFDLYVTRDLRRAKKYCTDRYADNSEKRYGLLASSKATILPRFEVPNGFMDTSHMKKGPWFNRPPTSPESCCRLDRVATEFACQGLELDFPIVCWGEDLAWCGGEWKRFTKASKGVHDPHQLRLNSYRVLLTRGRDGMIIYVPETPGLDSTFDLLRTCGAAELQD